MPRDRRSNPEGSVLLEALLAVGLTALLVVAIVGVSVRARAMVERSGLETRGAILAQEGVAALRGMTFSDLPAGVEGRVTWSDPNWVLQEGVPETIGVYTRQVAVNEVQRDGDCLVVPTGGDVDPDTRQVTSTVSFVSGEGVAREYVASQHVTNWTNPQGPCFLLEEAGHVTIDLSLVNWHGQKQLRNLYIENTGTATVTVDRVTFEWGYATSVDQVFLETTKVWSSSGPGTPAGSQTTGTELDILDVDLDPGDRDEMHKVQFSSTMVGDTISLTLHFSDGSELSTGFFTP